ncbi:hypothetical protein RCG23_03490 [Neobacillus sp. PS3-34]|uniref:hypothetical protein n=1 Tax=Neobacillus sp. PS3-34 TaxID=3070678 RepID=UPI0027E0C1E5|nr:hypothetical protein [Neobacillus sp. PS3-34]WML49168.1 hypothetical protein RCG23_03490 [Neobacillus sp. PS3-34]
MRDCYIVVYIIGRFEERFDKLNHYNREFKHDNKFIEDYFINWPFIDLSDDPSFLAYELSKDNGGKVTWGICRRDVRNKIKKDDMILFFGFDKFINPMSYYFIGYATVEEKIKQTEIWSTTATNKYKVYQKYCNILIKKNEQSQDLFYFEPIKYNHEKEWIWKITDGTIGEEKFKKEYFEKLSVASRCIPLNINIKDNYIIFSSDPLQTKIFKTPIKYAEWDGNNLSIINHQIHNDFFLERSIRVGWRHRHMRLNLSANLLNKIRSY